MLGRPIEDLKIITCHLGNGSSISAIDGGKSVDTSMGFTPLDGLPMGTRSGNIDPAIIDCLAEHKGCLLYTSNGTVTICHSRTENLAEICREADILVAAVGRANFVTPDMVKPGAAVIDVGMNRVDGRLCADVDPAVAEVAGSMTPVPGGVGPMTITMLMKNTLKAAQK